MRRDETARLALVALIVLAQVIAWTAALSSNPLYVPSQQVAAETLSTTAIILLSVNLVLATRARFLERGLQGLDKLYVTHRTFGISVALIVCAHFLIVPKSVGYVPSKPVGYTTMILILLTVFIASAPRSPWRGLVPLKYQTWKALHRLNGLLLTLAVIHSSLANTYVSHVPALSVYVYGVAMVGLAAWAYRETPATRRASRTRFAVSSARNPGADITEIVVGPRDLDRTPGQFAILTLAAGPTREDHPFTISSRSSEPPRFSIGASGDYTSALLMNPPPAGSTALVEGPYGAFDFRRGTPHQLWVAGGIGITPFLAMAPSVDEPFRVSLVWSVHDRAEAAYASELEAVAAANPHMRSRLHVTSEAGHLQLDPALLDAPASELSVFICGPLPMRKAMLEQAEALGVRRSRTFYEEFRLR